jgi:hypothetical protein
MIAVLIALSFAVPAAHAHKYVHQRAHSHGHAQKLGRSRLDRCNADAQRVAALELRIGSAANRGAELERLERELEKASQRARADCGS